MLGDGEEPDWVRMPRELELLSARTGIERVVTDGPRSVSLDQGKRFVYEWAAQGYEVALVSDDVVGVIRVKFWESGAEEEPSWVDLGRPVPQPLVFAFATSDVGHSLCEDIVDVLIDQYGRSELDALRMINRYRGMLSWVEQQKANLFLIDPPPHWAAQMDRAMRLERSVNDADRIEDDRIIDDIRQRLDNCAAKGVDAIRLLPDHLQVLYVSRRIADEFDQGGFNQVLAKAPDLAAVADEAFRLIGSLAASTLIKRAAQRDRTDSFDDLDAAFRAVFDGFVGLRVDYARRHSPLLGTQASDSLRRRRWWVRRGDEV